MTVIIIIVVLVGFGLMALSGVAAEAGRKDGTVE